MLHLETSHGYGVSDEITRNGTRAIGDGNRYRLTVGTLTDLQCTRGVIVERWGAGGTRGATFTSDPQIGRASVEDDIERLRTALILSAEKMVKCDERFKRTVYRSSRNPGNWCRRSGVVVDVKECVCERAVKAQTWLMIDTPEELCLFEGVESEL